MNKILITGGTGSWGNELVSRLLGIQEVNEIRIFSRNEHRQVEMRRKFSSEKLKFIIGDVRNRDSLRRATKNVDTIFHLAAMKHVPICEENSWQTVEVNIEGTQNVITEAMNAGVKLVVDISTDKAVDPHNIYGVTKSCAEKLIVNANYNYSTNTIFTCVRGGNVLGTNGSVIPLFKEQIENQNKVTITDSGMSRYLMKKKDAIELIFKAVRHAQGGEIFVMRMKSVTVRDIVDEMKKTYGNSDTDEEIIGSRIGEKTHEVLVSKNEAEFTYEIDETLYVIKPQNKKNYKISNKWKKMEKEEFNSQSCERITSSELYEMIKEEFSNQTTR